MRTLCVGLGRAASNEKTSWLKLLRGFIWLAAQLVAAAGVAPFTAATAAVDIEIDVTGLSSAMRDNVLSYLSIAQQKDHALATERLMRKLHEQAPEEIKLALQPFGYYRPSIQSSFEKAEFGWTAIYRVEAGPPLRITTFTLVLDGPGADDNTLQKKIPEIGLGRGDILDHARYEKAKETLVQTATENGYLDARFERHSITVDLDAYAATIDLAFDTGAQYRFGEIVYDQTILEPDFIKGYANFKAGDPYSIGALLTLQKSLADSGYFARIEVRPMKDQAANLAVPINVQLVPRKQRKYSVGMGYGTDTGVRGTVNWEHRYINRLGHRLDMELTAAEIRDGQSIRYIIPISHFQSHQIGFTASREHEKLSDRENFVHRLSASRTHSRGEWIETLAINYLYETFVIGGESGESTLLMPSGGWTWIDADDRVYPLDGTRIAIELRGSVSQLIANTDFAQTLMSFKRIRPLVGGRFIARAQLGLSAASRFGELPPSVRFFTGGDRTVRGYRYNSLAPTDAAGNVLGGRHMVLGGLEYERPIKGKWSAAVFADSGNAFDVPDLIKFNNGVGIGLRYRSRIGLIRLDLAWASDHVGWLPTRIHAVVGPDL